MRTQLLQVTVKYIDDCAIVVSFDKKVFCETVIEYEDKRSLKSIGMDMMDLKKTLFENNYENALLEIKTQADNYVFWY